MTLSTAYKAAKDKNISHKNCLAALAAGGANAQEERHHAYPRHTRTKHSSTGQGARAQTRLAAVYSLLVLLPTTPAIFRLQDAVLETWYNQ